MVILILILFYVIVSIGCFVESREEFIQEAKETSDDIMHLSDWIVAFLICCTWPITVPIDFVRNIQK